MYDRFPRVKDSSEVLHKCFFFFFFWMEYFIRRLEDWLDWSEMRCECKCCENEVVLLISVILCAYI